MNREQETTRSRDVTDTARKLDLCYSARKIIGFSPIEPRMLEIQQDSYGAKDFEEAKMMEVRSYLICELKMLPSDVNKLNIVRIFPPAKQNWNVLYVEFESEYEVDTIFSYTKNMVKQDHRLMRWIPRQMYERYRAVEGLAYSLRQENGLKTRVKIGRYDLTLSVRALQSSVWSNYPLPETFPDINLDSNVQEITSGRPLNYNHTRILSY